MVGFGTKAETLERLVSHVTLARILPQIRFSVLDWQEKQEEIINKVISLGGRDAQLIVRSSAVTEDLLTQSLAGHYKTIMNVCGEQQIIAAVTQVIESFGSGTLEDQVFIQPMLQDVAISGVIFSRDPNTGGHYYVINYDESGSTHSVTSGEANGLKVFYCFKSSIERLAGNMKSIIDMMMELETIFENDSLDAEFAISKTGELYLFQVRPLYCHHQSSNNEKEIHEKSLQTIYNKIEQWNRNHPYLHGSRTVFGVMPDWNPAEMIGVRPRPLALSMYKEMITDNIWAYQRSNYGYKNLRSFPLLIDFCGIPFIDVRVDFNSFIPNNLSFGLAEKLVDYYIGRLVEMPSNHDKVEFEIVYTCYTFDLPERIKKIKEYGFTDQECNEVVQSLRQLTNKIISGQAGLWRQDIARIDELENRYHQIIDSSLDIVSKIYWLIEDCKRYGTLPFAGLARAAFIATQIMKSLVSVGIINQQEYLDFMNDLDGIGSQMGRDFHALSKAAFLEKYGHVRPGTYDILSPCYKEEPDRYFDWSNVSEASLAKPKQFVLSLEQLRKIENLLAEHDLEHDLLGLFDFLKEAIEGREYSKFVFTRNISAVLDLFKQLGELYGFTVEDCSYANIDCIKKIYESSSEAKAILQRSIEEGRRKYELTSRITLPPVIIDPTDTWLFTLPDSEPNFITLKRTSGPVVTKGDSLSKFKDAVLMIPCADPGYDWVFSHQIAGLITMYGGANSHMAVRAGELGIPAVIGAGETLFTQWSAARLLEIDCACKQVRIIR